MSDSLSLDSHPGRCAMPKAYSEDLRERAIEAVGTGASRNEATERFEVSGKFCGEVAAALARE